MIRVLFLIFILVILFMCNQNEQFNEEEQICKKIPEGECNSKLCPSNCKIQHSEKSDKCYCIARK